MKKEEFLAMSLPYGLHCIVSGDATFKILSLHFENINLVRIHKTGYRDFPMTIPHIKPILRPLSDLTKPIEHNGEKFVPIERIAYSYGYEIQIFRNKLLKPIMCEQFNIVLQLIKWHFDIALLIEKGEAIDVNTLTENPYK